MHARIYDFTLGPGGMQQLPVVGDFFKVINALGAIHVNVDTGASLDLMPGQGLREFSFNTLTITDKSGAANAGKILVGFSSMIDDRVTGEVAVIDGGKARTLSGSAFFGSSGVNAVSGTYAHVQLENPAASGKRVVLEQVVLSIATDSMVSMRSGYAALASSSGGAASKLIGGAASAAVRRQENIAAMIGTPLTHFLIGASRPLPVKFAEPIVIAPGGFVTLASQTLNTNLFAAWEFFEEPA